MRKIFKKNYLGKKVLLSVLAAGVMGSFVLQPQAFAAETVNTDKLVLENGAKQEYVGGRVTGRAEAHADVAAEIRGGSTLTATNVDFTGEIAIDGSSKVVLTGGSVTSGVQRLDEGKLIEEGSTTEVGVRDAGSIFIANNVKLDTNLGAFDGGQIVINDSNINANHGIYVAGASSNNTVAMITLNGSNDITYSVGEFFEANDGGILKIHGGGTIKSEKEGSAVLLSSSNGADLEIESGDDATTEINGSIEVNNASMYVSGKLNMLPVNETERGSLYINGTSDVVFGKYVADERDEEEAGTIVGDDAFVKVNSIVIDNPVTSDVPEPELSNFTVAAGSELDITNNLTSTGIVKIDINGKLNAAALQSYSGTVININNGGKVDLRNFEQDLLGEFEYSGIKYGYVAEATNGEIKATNVDFYGGLWADQPDGKITVNGGSINALPSENTGTDAEHTFIRASENALIEVDNGTVIKSNVGAVRGGRVVIHNSTLEDAEGHTGDGAIFAEGTGSVVEINNTPTSNDGLYAWDGGQVNILNSDVNVIEAIAGDVDVDLSIANADSFSCISITGRENNVYSFTTMEAVGNSEFSIKGGKVNTGYVGVIGNASMNLSSGGTIDSSKLANYGHVRDYAVEVYAGTLSTQDVNIKGYILATNDGSIYLNGSKDTTYTINKYIVAADGGRIYIGGGTLKEDNLKAKIVKTTFKDPRYDQEPQQEIEANPDVNGIVLVGTGVISTMSDQIYANAASENQNNSGEITNKYIKFEGGTLSLNDEKYTLGYSHTALAELQKQGQTQLVMTGTMVEESGEVEESKDIGEIAGADDGKIEHDKLTANTSGNLLVGAGAGATGPVENVEVSQSVNNGFSVASVNLGAGSTGMVITNAKDVTLGGSAGGSVVTVDGQEANVTIVVGTNTTVAGATATKGTLNIGNSLAEDNTQYKLNGEVQINDGSALNTKGQVTVTEQISLSGGIVNAQSGSLTTEKLEVEHVGDVLGNVNATDLTLKSNTTLTNVGSDDTAGKLTVDKATLNSGMIFLDPAWRDGATISDASGLAVRNVTALDGAYIVGRNSVLSLGSDLSTAEAVFSRSEATWGANSVSAAAYVANTVNVAGGSLTIDGSLTAPAVGTVTVGTVKFADKSMLMVNGAATVATPAITGIAGDANASIDNGAKLYIDNAQNGVTYKILEGTDNGWNERNISSNNRLLIFNADQSTDSAFSVTAVSRAVSDVYGDAVIAPNTFDQAIIEGGLLADFIANAVDDYVNANTAAQVSAFNSAAAMSELAGVEHGTFAASNLFTDAVAEHLSIVNAKEHDKDIWAKYIHSKNNIDGLAIVGTNAKYDATYNGIVVGSDLYKQGNSTLGVALTYVDGSIKGNTLAAKTENDATYYGLSVYGGVQKEDCVLMGDISYLHGKNDITQRNSGMSLTADAKSDAFSIGVRAEKAFQAGKGKLAPYAGLRYMHLGTGNYKNSVGMAYDSEDMNLWLLPVGLKYSADIKNGDWTIRPVAELGYVWNMGDRNTNQTVSLNGASDGFGFDVADSGSYVGRFVVEAEKANITYSLGYEYQKGDSVKANKWMANVSWKF